VSSDYSAEFAFICFVEVNSLSGQDNSDFGPVSGLWRKVRKERIQIVPLEREYLTESVTEISSL
jgi:hypothetical protein